MIDNLVEAIVSRADLIVVAVLVVVVYAFFQALVNLLRDWFLVNVFKRKLRNNGSKNNGNMDAKFDELIAVHQEIGEKHDARMAAIETKVGGMHDIICETDENKFPKIRVMEKKVKEVWDRVVRKVNGDG